MATTMHAPPTENEEGQSSAVLDRRGGATADSHGSMAQDARFSCNICFDAVSEPVVTRCGHLYCWPCLFRWLEPGMTRSERASLGMPPLLAPLDESRRVCPVCKAGCSVPTLVPIYVRNDNNHNNNNNNNNNTSSTDARPKSPPPRSAKEETAEEDDAEPQRIYASSDFTSIEHTDSDNMGLDIDDDLGLDIDDNHHEDDYQHVIPTTVTTDNGTSLGLRQRHRYRTNNNDDGREGELNTAPTAPTAAIVPTRPVPSRDRVATSDTNLNSTGVVRAHSPVVDGGHATATLSRGLVLAMHQTLLQATNSNAASETNGDGAGGATESIPSLHYPQRRDSVTNESSVWEQDPASTIFLSRLLLGLSLFVLFCLLSF